MVHTIVVGLSHKTAPVEVREKLAFSETQLGTMLDQLLSFPHLQEGVILSTCNRTEIYATTANTHAGLEDIKQFIRNQIHLTEEEFDKYFFVLMHQDGLMHLFRVASGLDSLVIGEGQIMAQVKSAHAMALAAGACKKILNNHFRQAIFAGKRVRTETDIGRRAVSTSSAAIELAKQKLKTLEDKFVLLVGAGKIGEVTLKHLASTKVGRLGIMNRSEAKAQELVQQYGGEALPYSVLFKALTEADLAIVGTASPHYLITPDNFSAFINLRAKKDLILIDISVPRNIDPEVGKIEGVTLYDIDDLALVVESNLKERHRLLNQAETILQEELGKATQWMRSLSVVPTITLLREKMEKIREGEVEEALRRMGGKMPMPDFHKEAINALTKAIVNKILHDPISVLKNSEDSGMQEQYLESVKALFQIEKREEEKKKASSSKEKVVGLD